jgi:hypothetical protein
MNTADDEGFESALQDDERDAATALERGRRDGEPAVLLDVSELRVDEISLEVEDLRARVSLDADVLSLLKLHVGVEAQLGRVQLTIKGVEAKVLLKVRLDNVARILDRVLTTIDNNPEIVEHLTAPVSEAAEELGEGVGHPVGALGTGAGSAVEEVAETAGTAVGDVGRDAGGAVEDVSRSAGRAVDDVAGEARQRRPRKAKPSRQATQAEAPRRRRSAATPKKRPTQGSRSSRARRTKED